MIYTAPFLMRADPLRGQVGGGWALEVEAFLALLNTYNFEQMFLLTLTWIKIGCKFFKHNFHKSSTTFSKKMG
jgi:hypothetical protein